MKVSNFPVKVKPDITATIIQEDGTRIELVNRDFAAGSVSFKSGTSNSGEFTVGAAIIGEFRFSLMNDKGKFANVNFVNATIEPVLTASGVSLPMGKYWFVNHKESGPVISCETYDALKILDEHCIYEDELTYPTTVSAIVGKIAAARGLTVSGLANGSIPVDDPGDDDMTERECIAYLAQMTGQFVTAKGTTLCFGWYDKNNPVDAGVTFSHDLQTNSVVVSGVKVYADDSDAVAVHGSGYTVEINDNPFITEANLEAVANAIYASVSGVSFTPGTFEIVANPAIEAGDVLSITTDRLTITVYATNITYKLQLRESITADADPYVGDLRITRKQKISKIAKKAAEKQIKQDLNDKSSALSQAIGAGGGGLPIGDDDIQLAAESGVNAVYDWKRMLFQNVTQKLWYLSIMARKAVSDSTWSFLMHIGVSSGTALLNRKIMDLQIGDETHTGSVATTHYGTAAFTGSGGKPQENPTLEEYHTVKQGGLFSFRAKTKCKKTPVSGTNGYKVEHTGQSMLGHGAVTVTDYYSGDPVPDPYNTARGVVKHAVVIGDPAFAEKTRLKINASTVFNEAVVIEKPDGSLYQICVNDDGTLSAVPYDDLFNNDFPESYE